MKNRKNSMPFVVTKEIAKSLLKSIAVNDPIKCEEHPKYPRSHFVDILGSFKKGQEDILLLKHGG